MHAQYILAQAAPLEPEQPAAADFCVEDAAYSLKSIQQTAERGCKAATTADPGTWLAHAPPDSAHGRKHKELVFLE